MGRRASWSSKVAVGYRELPLPGPRPELVVSGSRYDLDAFGMDDARSDDPDDAFRFIFELGAGLTIWVYVIQAGGRRDSHHFAHTLWLEDCAAAHVEPENRGPPASVEAAQLSLPLVYETVTVGGRTLSIVSQTFDAALDPTGEQRLRMEIAVRDADGAAGLLSWDRSAAWEIEVPGARRVAVALADLAFGPAGR